MTQKPVQPDYSTDSGSAYPTNIDKALSVVKRPGDRFAPYQQDVGSPQPDMSVRIAAGFVFDGKTKVEVAAQTVSGFTTPAAGTHRIDRVVIDEATGVASRVAGTAAVGSPSATPPAIPAGKEPCCQVLLTDSDTVILGSMITDERSPITGHAVGALVLIQETIVSAAVAAVDFTSGIDGTYDEYVFELISVTPVTDAVELQMRTDSDGGASFDAGANDYPFVYTVFAASAANTGVGNSSTAGTDRIALANSSVGGVSNSASLGGFNGWVSLISPASTTRSKRVRWEGEFYIDATDVIATVRGAGYRNDPANDVNAVRFLFSSGNVASGTIRMYGRKKP